MMPDEERHSLANHLTQEGIGLLAIADDKALSHALHCFEQAVHLRSGLPLDEQPWYRWGLTAGLMNQADVLARMGQHGEALASYDRAIEHLQQLPLELEPGFRWRLGLAWMNRGLTLQSRGQEHLGAALASVDEAIQTLNHPSLTTARDQGTLGCAWLNRAAMLMGMAPARPDEAQEAATQALLRLQPFEQTDLIAAEASLKARHRYCHATATLLETPPVNSDSADAWILAAEDHVEEALALVDLWRGQGDFSEIALELFRFGCRIYLAFQPQFLGEFMLDVLRPDLDRQREEAFYEAAEESLVLAAEVLRHRGIDALGSKRVEDLLEMLAKLESATRQIHAWHDEATSQRKLATKKAR
jgi:tetratricopeptide (TPR) repeat protein